MTEDGTLIVLARFESEEAARANSERPEQGEWWAEASKAFTGDVTFHDSSDVVTDVPGDPDRAGFVQVMQGRGTDVSRAQELMSQSAPQLAELRPEILGRIVVSHGDGGYTMAVYFTSEEAARKGESQPITPELHQIHQELQSLNEGVPDFYDLKHPWLDSPK